MVEKKTLERGVFFYRAKMEYISKDTKKEKVESLQFQQVFFVVSSGVEGRRRHADGRSSDYPHGSAGGLGHLRRSFGIGVFWRENSAPHFHATRHGLQHSGDFIDLYLYAMYL